jgi:Tfp pilus assembly protein PilW
MTAELIDDPRLTCSQQGFSMVEMLVALVFTSLLMVGMAGVFKGSIRAFTTINETLGAQRTNRWAVEQVMDDISQAGFLFPDRALPTSVLAAAESLFSITPNVAVTGAVRISDTSPTATVAENLTADVLEFFSDVPLPVAGTWAVDTTAGGMSGGVIGAAPTSASINYTRGAYTDLQAGDVMVILDSGENGAWEHPVIAGAANPVVFETSAVNLAKYTSANINAGIANSHVAGVPVFFIRPNQLTRYSVQAVALDPANSSVKLPALVRQQTAYPASGTVDWTTVPAQLVAENVQGLRVDISFDG